MSAIHHILLVDDDQTLRDALAEQLALYEEFKISTAETATGGIKAVQAERIDLAVMDVGLPDMDGREAVKLMRKNGFKSPVIMLTGQGSDADTVLGLEAGARRSDPGAAGGGRDCYHARALAGIRSGRGAAW